MDNNHQHHHHNTISNNTQYISRHRLEDGSNLIDNDDFDNYDVNTTITTTQQQLDKEIGREGIILEDYNIDFNISNINHNDSSSNNNNNNNNNDDDIGFVNDDEHLIRDKEKEPLNSQIEEQYSHTYTINSTLNIDSKTGTASITTITTNQDEHRIILSESDRWPEWKKNAASLFWIIVWVSLNMSLQFCNKYLFTIGFKYPVFIILTGTFITFCGSFICVFFLNMSEFPKAALKRRWKMITLCGVFQASTYVLENISIVSIPISLNQIIKATAPAFIIALQILVDGEKFPLASIISTLVIILGAVLSVYKNPDFALDGFLYSMASTLFATFQTVLIASLQQDKTLTTLSLVMCTSFPSVIAIIPMFAARELPEMIREPYPHPLFPSLLTVGLAFAAFFYNLSHFYIVKYTSALYYAVVGNAKVVALIVISSIIFHTDFVPINIVGMAITLLGFFAYNYLTFKKNQEAKYKQLQEDTSGSNIQGDHTSNGDNSIVSNQIIIDDNDYEEDKNNNHNNNMNNNNDCDGKHLNHDNKNNGLDSDECYIGMDSDDNNICMKALNKIYHNNSPKYLNNNNNGVNTGGSIHSSPILRNQRATTPPLVDKL